MALFLHEWLDSPPKAAKTCKCGQSLSGADPHTSEVVEGKEVCSDCLTKQVSELIDQHPSGRLMSRV